MRSMTQWLESPGSCLFPVVGEMGEGYPLFQPRLLQREGKTRQGVLFLESECGFGDLEERVPERNYLEASHSLLLRRSLSFRRPRLLQNENNLKKSSLGIAAKSAHNAAPSRFARGHHFLFPHFGSPPSII